MTSGGAELMRRARDGSNEALGELVERYSGKLLALIRLRMGDLRRRMESRDVLQSTLIKALGAIDRFEGEKSGPFLAWLATIAHHEIADLRDHHRAQRRRLDLEDALSRADHFAASVASMVSRIALDERSRKLETALLELPEAQREAVILRSYEELGFAEIGERLGRSADAARMLYARAMTALTVEMRRVTKRTQEGSQG